MSASITFDTRQWDQAMKEYQDATKKDSAEVVNRQVRNWAVKAGTLMKKADRSEVQNLTSRDWWCKYISKILSGKLTLSAGAQAYNPMFAITMKKKRGRGHGTKMVNEWHKLAVKTSNQIIRQRTGAIQFCKFFFFSIATGMQNLMPVGQGGVPRSRLGDWFSVEIKPATPENSTCEFATRYNYKLKSASTAQTAEHLLQLMADKATQNTITDMRQYAAEKMAKAAAKASAK